MSKTSNTTETSSAALKPPKSPPRILFRIPNDAKLASLVSAFPAKEIAKTIARKVMIKAVMLAVLSDYSKYLAINSPA